MLAIFLKVLVPVGTKLLIAMGSERMIEWAFFKIADSIVKTTKTPHDDEWLEKLKESYYAKDNK